MRHVVLWLALVLCLCLGCVQGDAVIEDSAALMTDGRLPEDTSEGLRAEWAVFRARHPDIEESEALRQFWAIQALSRRALEVYGDQASRVAAWAERRSLVRQWLSVNIEAVYHPSSVNDDFVQQAIDAYAFGSGHPTLVTASHVLVQPDPGSTPSARREAMLAIREALAAGSTVDNEALGRAALELLRAGFHVEVNTDLEFPRTPMQSFLGDALSYRAVVEPFAAAAFALNDAQPLSAVVESEFGDHIILFRQRREGRKPELESVRAYMLELIVRQGRRLAVQQKLVELEEQSVLRVDKGAMQAAVSGVAREP